MTEATRFLLGESDIPARWYNVQADLPEPLPPVIHPGTGSPIGPADLAPLFPMELIGQEVSRERWIEVPEEVREIYRLWRPTPYVRARRLDEALACRESGEERTIAFNLCGHGHFDMGAYDEYLAERLPDFEYAEEDVERALAELPAVN